VHRAWLSLQQERRGARAAGDTVVCVCVWNDLSVSLSAHAVSVSLIHEENMFFSGGQGSLLAGRPNASRKSQYTLILCIAGVSGAGKSYALKNTSCHDLTVCSLEGCYLFCWWKRQMAFCCCVVLRVRGSDVCLSVFEVMFVRTLVD